MPWRGPEVDGEYPSLGFLVGEWIEEHCIIPDGERFREPYLLTDEMWRFLLNYYRLRPDGRLKHYGAQLMRPQKWGKDPLGAAIAVAEALGPVRFDGWDADGEPVGRPVATPLIQVAATAEEQTENTWRPIYRQFTEGPLADWPGVDAGLSRVNLPGNGMMEPVTMSARARLGAPINFATLTESHLMTASSGGLAMAKAMKRNLAGMDGRWIELTNAPDPAEESAALATMNSKRDGVYIDYRPPRTRVEMDDVEGMLDEIIYVYGDSIRSAGGWVNEERILDDATDPATGESETRRYFLNELSAGTSDFLDILRWQTLACEETLAKGALIALGFDGSRSRDGTALIGCRISDGFQVNLGIWYPVETEVDGERVAAIDREAVSARVADVFKLYDVAVMFADPFKWESYIDVWAGRYPDRVVEFPTNSETRMDKAIHRTLTDFANGEVTHDGSSGLADHIRNTVLVKGGKKKTRDADDPLSDHYRKLAKRRGGFIDASVALVLSREARGWAIEHGALSRKKKTGMVVIA